MAGVRYRAWQPPACLHPTIPVHTPLVFDIVDTWNGRAIGGCTYHVAHRAAGTIRTFPVNAYGGLTSRPLFPLWHTRESGQYRRKRTRSFPIPLTCAEGASVEENRHLL